MQLYEDRLGRMQAMAEILLEEVVLQVNHEPDRLVRDAWIRCIGDLKFVKDAIGAIRERYIQKTRAREVISGEIR